MADANGGFVEVGQKEAESSPHQFMRFKSIGDSFSGKLLRILENQTGTYGAETHYIFQTKAADGQLVEVAVNPNPDLRKRYSVLAIGDFARTTKVGEKNIGKESPMNVFKVEKWTGPLPQAAAPTPAPKPLTASDAPF